MNDGERFDSVEDVFIGLDRAARTLPSGAVLMDKEVQTVEQFEEARQYIDRVIQAGDVSQAELARRVDCSASSISALRNQKWKGNIGLAYTLATKLVRAINILMKQRAADSANPAEFVRTRVAEEIFTLVDFACTNREIVIFTLPAGSGKTVCLEAVCDDRPGTLFVTVTKSRSNHKAFLQLIARAAGVNETGLVAEIQDRICDRLRDSGRLLIVDEAHQLSAPALGALRELFDSCRIPMCLSGTPTFLVNLQSHRISGVKGEVLDQFYTRVGMSRNLDDLSVDKDGNPSRGGLLFSRDDVRRLFAKRRVRLSRDGLEFLTRLANTLGSGGLRTAVKLVRIVTTVQGFDELVTAARLKSALALKEGTSAASFRPDAIESDETPDVAATA